MAEGIYHDPYPSFGGDVPLTIKTAQTRCRCGNRVVIPLPLNDDSYTEYLKETMRAFADFCQAKTDRDLLAEWNMEIAQQIYDKASAELLCRDVEQSPTHGEEG